ncbi:MAG TPA: type II secretion system protein N [Gemmatimonadales bacterium]|nr:type II secretion system protein N [Gemmatimonadales bacterium]
MQATHFERSGFAQSAAVSLVIFAALALLGLVLAYWTWAWFAPSPEPRVQAALAGGRAAGPTHAATALLGNARRDTGGDGPAGLAARLLGVVAASGGQPGYAVLRLDAKQTVAVREGEELEPGVRLAEVHADHVVLEQGGARETLAWPKPDKSALPAAPRAKN